MGTYDGGLQLLACFDPLCREAVPGTGSAIRVTIDQSPPGDASAFVLGPRGVAALPLPASVGAAAFASVVRRPATAQPN